MAYLTKRKSYFLKLLNIANNFCVWCENPKWSAWLPISDFNIDELMLNPYIHREILPNELVFDIDGKSWEKVRELGKRLESIFEDCEIPFNRWSSGRFLHYHIFLDEKEALETLAEQGKPLLVKVHFEKTLKMKEDNVEKVIEFRREVYKHIPLVLLKKLKVKGAYVDLNKFKASRRLIRAEGSVNPKTLAFKTYLQELPENQPLIKNIEEVNFPAEIKIWKPEPEFLEDLFFKAYWDYVRVKPIPKLTTSKKISWIEKLLDSPLPDGRRRAINLIFSPYFMNVVRVDEQTALTKILEWLKRCDKLRKTNITLSYITYQLRYAKRRKLKPLSKKKVKEIFKDVILAYPDCVLEKIS